MSPQSQKEEQNRIDKIDKKINDCINILKAIGDKDPSAKQIIEIKNKLINLKYDSNDSILSGSK